MQFLLRVKGVILLEHSFQDIAGNKIELTFNPTDFCIDCSDVLLFPFYDNGIVMTKHPRGLELPGGKIEQGELAIQAAIREMWEETGGILSGLMEIGQYSINQVGDRTIVKAIYWAKVSHFVPQPSGYETNGYELVPTSVNVQQVQFSPFVKDAVFSLTLEHIKQLEIGSNGKFSYFDR